MKSECLDRVIAPGERPLRHLLAEYVAHDHTERNHQSLLTFDLGRHTSDSAQRLQAAEIA
jgi:hypothetical protein